MVGGVRFDRFHQTRKVAGNVTLHDAAVLALGVVDRRRRRIGNGEYPPPVCFELSRELVKSLIVATTHQDLPQYLKVLLIFFGPAARACSHHTRELTLQLRVIRSWRGPARIIYTPTLEDVTGIKNVRGKFDGGNGNSSISVVRPLCQTFSFEF